MKRLKTGSAERDRLGSPVKWGVDVEIYCNEAERNVAFDVWSPPQVKSLPWVHSNQDKQTILPSPW